MIPTRIAFIGAGKQPTKNHLPILKKLSEKDECVLRIVCDINADTAQKAHSIFAFEEWTTDAQEIFKREDIDAVYIVGTVPMHYDYMMQALNAGKHVFVEKPPALNTEQTILAANLAQKKNKIAVAGLNRRFYASINYAKNILRDNSEIYSVEGSYNKTFLRGSYAYDSSSWITYSSIHGIDAISYIMGEEPPVSLYSTWNKAPDSIPENISALFVWGNGAHATLSSNNTAGSRMENYVIHSLGKSYACDESEITSFCENEEETKVFKSTEDPGGFLSEHVEFLKAIKEGFEPRNSIRRSVFVMYLAELIEKKHAGAIDWNPVYKLLESTKPEAITRSIESIRKRRDKINYPKILVMNPGGMKYAVAYLSEYASIVDEKSLQEMEKDECSQISAVITGIGGGNPVSDEILSILPSLKVVGVVGASVKKYNPEGILERGIPIINASSIYANAVAEFNLMQALIGIKNASRSHDVMRSGNWGILTVSSKDVLIQKIKILVGKKIPAPIRKLIRKVIPVKNNANNRVAIVSDGARGGKNLKGLTVGIIGYGEIAKKFIALLKPFECKIKVSSNHLSEKEAGQMGVVCSSLGDVLNADIVSLHRGLSEKTKKSFGKNEINSIKPGAIFLNTARGEIVDEDALISRLKKGDIFACLDVFSEEPLSPNSELRKLSNVFLSSHIGGATKETYGLAGNYVAEKVLAYLRGEDVDGLIVSKDRLATMT